MGFDRQAARLERVWRLYAPGAHHRLPPRLLSTAARVLPHVVDEIAYQTRRNLGHRALADVIRFQREDEAAIEEASCRLVEGRAPQPTLEPRFLVSAASYALSSGGIGPAALSKRVVERLAGEHPPAPPTLRDAKAALAA